MYGWPYTANYALVKHFGYFFPIKDKVKKEHLSDLVYEYECDISIGCDPNYLGETGVKIGTHVKTDKN